jgi:hypothetical protein
MQEVNVRALFFRKVHHLFTVSPYILRPWLLCSGVFLYGLKHVGLGSLMALNKNVE